MRVQNRLIDLSSRGDKWASRVLTNEFGLGDREGKDYGEERQKSY